MLPALGYPGLLRHIYVPDTGAAWLVPLTCGLPLRHMWSL